MASTLTRNNSRGPSGQKPEYKDYVNFLDSYKYGKKDNESTTTDSGISSIQSYPLTNSNNTSNSSLNSDQTDFSKTSTSSASSLSCRSFSNYLENIQAKKFGPVKPKISNVQENNNKKQLMKSEIFIQVTSPKPTTQITKTVTVKPQNANKSYIAQKAKVFENGTLHQVPPSSTTLKSESTTRGNVKIFENGTHQAPSSITKKSESTTGTNNGLKKTLEKFEASNNSQNKPILKIQIPEALKKLDISNGEAIKNGSPPLRTVNKEEKNVPQIIIGEKQVCQMNVITPPPQMYGIPIPPPMNGFGVSTTSTPPPPPPPMIDLSHPLPKSPGGPLSPKPVIMNKPSHILPKQINNNNSNNNNDNNQNPPISKNNQFDGQKLDKNDPRVRKLVYGTLRGMYGAYHDKANDIVATLPRSMVRKDNGIQNIINVIASNGDLEKLNGRINPKLEQDNNNMLS